MLRVNEDKQLYALARELMESEGFDEVEAVREARELLQALREYAKRWDTDVARAQQCTNGGQHGQY